MSNFHFEVPHNFTPKDKKINLIKDSYNYVQKQTSALRRTWPEYMVLKVVTVYRDNTFDLTTPDEEHLFERVMAIDPRAKDFYRPGKAVTVRFNNVNGGRPYIKFGYGFMGDAVDLTVYDIFFGDGSWITPEADYLLSAGLITAADRQIKVSTTLGTLSQIATVTRFETGSDLYGDTSKFINISDQLGLLSFTVADGVGGTVTVLALFTTLWYHATASIIGTSAKIREFSIAGSTSGLFDNKTWSYSSYFPGYEVQQSKGPYYYNRRNCYFFIDLITLPAEAGIYVVALETGIYAHKREASSTVVHTNWAYDKNRPNRTGNIQSYGKYLLECGYLGTDRSDNALNEFNGTLQGNDPAHSYTYNENNGYYDLVSLPDDAGRSVLHFYVRKEDLTYDHYALDLRAIFPQTIYRLYSCGTYRDNQTNLYDEAGAELKPTGDPEGIGLILSPSSAYTFWTQSSRWPVLAYTVASVNKIEFWFWVCFTEGTGVAIGQSYWSLVALDAISRTFTVKNQLVTAGAPTLLYPSAEWLAAQMSTWEAYAEASMQYEAASSLMDPGSDGDYPTINESGELINTPLYFPRRLQGVSCDGFDPEPGKNNRPWASDKFIPHPLPGDTTDSFYAFQDEFLFDSIYLTSRQAPSGVFDQRGHHFQILSEPFHYADGTGLSTITPIVPTITQVYPANYYFIYQDVPADWAQSTFYKYFEAGVFPEGEEPDERTVLIVGGYWDDGDGIVFHPSYSYGPLTWTSIPCTYEERYHAPGLVLVGDFYTRYKTWLVVTSPTAPVAKIDISEYKTWGSAGTLFQNIPLLACVWQWEVVGNYLFIVRQCFTGTYDPGINAREPYLEIRNKVTGTVLYKESLRPAGGTTHSCMYDFPPIFRTQKDSQGNAYAQIYTSWLASGGDATNFSQRIHVKTDIKFTGSINREEHIYTGIKETNIPSPHEISNMVINGRNMFWAEGSNSVEKYTPPDPV